MLAKIAGSVREYKRESILSPIFVTLEVIMEVLIPFLMADIIDKGIAGGDMSYTVKLGIVMIFAAAASLLFGVLSGKYAAYASTGLAANLRTDLFHRIQDFSFANIDKFSTSSLVTRLTTDVTNVLNAYQMIIRVLVRAPIMLIAALVMSMRINLRLSLIFVAAIAVLGAGLTLITLKAYPFFARVFRRYDRLNCVVQENVNAVRVVKAYVREDHEVKKFKEISKDVFCQFISAEKIIAFNAPLMQFTMYACVLLVSWIGGRFVVAESMTTGQLTSFIVYATQILSSLVMMSMVLVMVMMAQASAERIVEVLEEDSSMKNTAAPIAEVKSGDIVLDHVDFSYVGNREKLALQNIDLHIKAGETISIIGGTGSGKSSLVQLIPRLYDVTAGSVKVDGIDVKQYEIEALRDEVAMVLQKNVLFSGSIRENLKWGNEQATDEEMMHAARLAQAHDFIMQFEEGYDTILEQGGTNVSGGQRQRLCIARALLKKPRILILDDSTSAVDTKTDAQIRRAFREEIPDTTKIIVAQRISSIEDADQIIVMDGGRINGIGSHEELIKTNRIYQEVYRSQMKGAA